MSAVLFFRMCWRTSLCGSSFSWPCVVTSCGAPLAAHGWFGGGFADSRRPGDVGSRALCADVNPLVSLHSVGLPHHRGVAHWLLGALLAASLELSSDSGLKEKLRVIRQMLVEWERKLAQLSHRAVVMLGSGQRERLKLLLREIRWRKGTQFNPHAILEGVWQVRATRDGELRWI